MDGKLYFDDLVILTIIQKNQSDHFGVVFSEIGVKANEWLLDNGVPNNYCLEFSQSRSEMQKILSKLRGMKLIYAVWFNKGVRLTSSGEMVLGRVGQDWRKWFLSAPVEGGIVLFDEAIDADQLREKI